MIYLKRTGVKLGRIPIYLYMRSTDNLMSDYLITISYY